MHLNSPIALLCRSYRLKSLRAVTRVTGGQNADVQQTTIDDLANGGDVIVGADGADSALLWHCLPQYCRCNVCQYACQHSEPDQLALLIRTSPHPYACISVLSASIPPFPPRSQRAAAGEKCVCAQPQAGFNRQRHSH